MVLTNTKSAGNVEGNKMCQDNVIASNMEDYHSDVFLSKHRALRLNNVRSPRSNRPAHHKEDPQEGGEVSASIDSTDVCDKLEDTLAQKGQSDHGGCARPQPTEHVSGFAALATCSHQVLLAINLFFHLHCGTVGTSIVAIDVGG